MDRVIPVVGVNFILLTTGFTLIFARLIARDRIAGPPDDSVFPPQPRPQPSEFGGKGANMPLFSTSLLRTILL
jgi:hypothetical protein